MNYKRKQAPPENLVGPRVSFLSRLIRCRFNEVIAQEGLYSGQQDIIFALIEMRVLLQVNLQVRAAFHCRL